ncbi:MAG: GntR family transcriptional regulator [Pseudomonadota bacterium]|nr:GntR family transcriptional regulator [Pseudomonadota bacterium]
MYVRNSIASASIRRSKAAEPRHRIASRRMLELVASGDWPLGALLPTESELEAEFGLSRYGVRQAVQVLCDLGLVSRQQGVGTRVIATTASTRYIQSVGNLDDIVQYVKGTRLDITTRKRIAGDIVLREFASLQGTGLAAMQQPDRWLLLKGVRYARTHELPVALAEVYVNDRYSDLPALGRVVSMPIYTHIEQRFGVRMTRVEQEIFGVRIAGEAADALRVRAGAAGLRVVRKYFVDHEIIDITIGTHPAERFSYATTYELDVGHEAQEAGHSIRGFARGELSVGSASDRRKPSRRKPG